MDLQNTIKVLVADAVAACQKSGLAGDQPPQVIIGRPKRAQHGDFSCNVALMLAKSAKRKPRDLAQDIIAHIQDPDGILERTEIAGPGFLNFHVSAAVWRQILGDMLGADTKWGQAPQQDAPNILIEFVSANPTGPLHIGHGRGAVAGDALARLLRFAGYQVTTEYYLNDAGSQVLKLGRSIQARALELQRERDPSTPEWPFPEDGYPGEYVKVAAASYLEDVGVPPAEELQGAALEEISEYGVAKMRELIAATLERMGIEFDVWSSEKALHRSGALSGAVQAIADAGHMYEKDGAQWFRSTDFGDEKDRVVIRDSGDPTYFAADIAYHRDKYERGADWLINIWGADHHGYIARMKGAVAALGRKPESLEILLVQFVALLKGGKKLQQGKRLGQFVTVDEVLDQVGPDVTRYFFLERKCDSQVDFDLEVALSENPRENPAKYAQYGHARACSILAKAKRELSEGVPEFTPELAARLSHPDELAILRHLADFPTLVQEAAQVREPHRIVSYLHDLARAFQSYYTRLKRERDPVLPPADSRAAGWESQWDVDKMRARLLWLEAFRIVTRNALTLLGLEAPEVMVRLEETEETDNDNNAGGNHA